ncbi:MAG: TraB/GumN family protein [Burkholderiales bacterium]
MAPTPGRVKAGANRVALRAASDLSGLCGAHRRRRGILLSTCLLAFVAFFLAPSAARAAEPASCAPDVQALASAQIEAALHEADQGKAAAQEIVLGPAPDRGFLWRIERDGRTSWLYGTVHVGRAAWLIPGPLVLQAIKASDTIALELDVQDADIQRQLAEGMRAKPGEAVPKALEARLQAQLAAQCLPPAAMAQLSPMVQLAALTTLAARADGLDPAFAIDSFLATIARVLGKQVVSLETPEAQLALIRGDPKTADERLDSGLADLEQGKVRPMLLRVASIWDEGRADELARYEAWCDCADTEAERAELKRLLDDRNPPLAERIARLHAGGQRVFAAVGSLHMFGPQGLPQLLAQRGFEVRRIEFKR